MKKILLVVCCLPIVSFGLLSACSKSGESKAQATGPKTPTPEELLAKAGDVTLGLKSVQFSLRREGKPAMLNEKMEITFTEATCSYLAPDRAGSVIKVGLKNGNQMQIEKVWVPEGIFMTNPLTKTFMRVPDAVFNVVALFQANGIPDMLKTGIQKTSMVGKEKLNGRENCRIKGEAEGKKVAPLLADTVPAVGIYPVDVWIEPDTGHVSKMRLDLGGGDAFVIELYAFNEPVEVKSPKVGA